MCGIFGFVVNNDSEFRREDVPTVLKPLFLLSESRGKEAAGLALADKSQITVLKRPFRAKKVIWSDEYKSIFKDYSQPLDKKNGSAFAVIGHSRMVTNGSQHSHDNNQPVIRDGMVCIHNGIVVNDNERWEEHPEFIRRYEVDTEIILKLIGHYQKNDGLTASLRKAFKELQGANSIALLHDNRDFLTLATTNGSLFFVKSDSGAELIFASEKYILQEAIAIGPLRDKFSLDRLIHIKPNEGYLFSFDKLAPQFFSLTSNSDGIREPQVLAEKRRVVDLKPKEKSDEVHSPALLDSSVLEQYLDINEKAISALKRCKRCLLPETFPYIVFDDEGVCHFCTRHSKRVLKGEKALSELVDPCRKTNGEPDCLVPISGGRDSCYSLHYIKNTLGMNPVAYTYDWGLVTDLARRNISRMCGELGVEHILISADITKKRDNIRKNINAWLKKPHLGTIPLFMAGDKQFFYFSRLLQKNMKLGMVMFGMNPLERTDFKVAFCNIENFFSANTYPNLTYSGKARLVAFYMKEFLSNPGLLNSSIFDTMFAFFSYYLQPVHYHIIFDYIPWIEDVINTTLIEQYGWETAPDTKSTWRIGDGTAAFYNYIYYRVCGFSENDTFRSNQIREGLISREKAMELVEDENRPRLESFQWYCNAVGVDAIESLKRINKIPTLF